MHSPTFIPCVTVSREAHKKHLCSPTKRKPLLRAEELTIVDCFTFALRLNSRRIDPLDHYKWFIDLAEEIQHEDGVVLIAPDCDWLGTELTLELSDTWLSKINAKVMPVVHSNLFNMIEFENTVGYAINSKYNGPAHPVWTHSFSQYYNQLNGPTELWTYDSTNY
jgi:hypothetical protein